MYVSNANSFYPTVETKGVRDINDKSLSLLMKPPLTLSSPLQQPSQQFSPLILIPPLPSHISNLLLSQPGELDAADTALMIQVLERLLNDDTFLDDEIKKEIKQYDNDGNLKIDRAEFQVN